MPRRRHRRSGFARAPALRARERPAPGPRERNGTECARRAGKTVGSQPALQLCAPGRCPPRRCAMKTIIFLIAVLLGAGATALAVDPPPGEGFKAYRYVRVRNIFDPSRRTDPLAETAVKTVTTNGPQRPQFIALTGTMVRPEKTLGFFTGTAPDAN